MTLSADKAQRERAIEAARRITLRYVPSKLEDKAEDAIRQVIEAEIVAAFETGRREGLGQAVAKVEKMANFTGYYGDGYNSILRDAASAIDDLKSEAGDKRGAGEVECHD